MFQMDALVLLVLLLALVGGSEAGWCVCKSDQPQQAQQKALDYACGNGADCNPILQNGACYNPNTVSGHCSYAANSYYQRKGQTTQACDFSGTATVVQQDPSPGGGCTYPATPSAAGTSTGTTTGTPTGTPTGGTPTGTPTGGTPTGGTPTGTPTGTPGSSATPSTGTGGTFTPGTGGGTGAGTGSGTGSTFTPSTGTLGPSGTSFNPDGSNVGFLPKAKMGFLFLVLLLTCLVVH